MTIRHDLPRLPFALVAAVLAILIMAGCPQPTPAPAPPPPSEKVFVMFEGPWGFAPDPSDANFVFAMAPKTSYHRDLYVKASYYRPLDPGVYELSIPPRTAPPAGTVSPDIVRATIAPSEVQRVLAAKLSRYVIRLPKPEAYAPSGRYNSRIGTSYPPDPNTQARPWATAVSLQYSVGSLNTFQLTGTPDNGTFPPFPLQVDTPHIRFVIFPLHDDDPNDKCFNHERQAFHDLTKLIGVTLYVDYPESPDSCHDNDPQHPHGAKASLGLPSLFNLTQTFQDGNFTSVQEAGMAPSWLNSMIGSSTTRVVNRVEAMYFFAAPQGDCKVNPIVGGP